MPYLDPALESKLVATLTPLLATLSDATAQRRHLATLNWVAARADVRPFLEHERDLQMVSPSALEQLLG